MSLRPNVANNVPTVADPTGHDPAHMWASVRAKAGDHVYAREAREVRASLTGVFVGGRARSNRPGSGRT